MSDFASLLSSFKQDASAVSAASKSGAAVAAKGSKERQQNKPSRKRPLATTSAPASPHFPSMHSNKRKNTDFELTFLGIGAQKAGTTWLHKLLHKCSDISLPQEQKEVHFWDWHHRKGFEWYIRQFDFHSQKASSASAPHYGEITPCYVVLPEATIAELYKCFPNLKIIFVARDLVDRAWSAMIMELRDQTMGLSAGEFANGVTTGTDKNNNSHHANKRTKLSAAQQRRLEQQSSPSSQPDSYFMDRLRNATHDSRSNYAKHLSNWYKHFPSSSILLIDYREIESNPRDVLLKVVMHIGAKEEQAKQFVTSLNDNEVGQRVNAATTSGSGSSTGSSSTSSHQLLTQRPVLKRQMERYLQPYAREFNDMLKTKGYDWRLDDFSLEKEIL